MSVDEAIRNPIEKLRHNSFYGLDMAGCDPCHACVTMVRVRVCDTGARYERPITITLQHYNNNQNPAGTIDPVVLGALDPSLVIDRETGNR